LESALERVEQYWVENRAKSLAPLQQLAGDRASLRFRW
jgi:hypothetical protein